MHTCADMRTMFAEQSGLVYIAKFREFGIRILDGGTSMRIIYYCPWCGQKLPTSLRDEWFDRIEHLGLEPDSPEIPLELTTDDWWKSAT